MRNPLITSMFILILMLLSVMLYFIYKIINRDEENTNNPSRGI